MSEKMTTYWLRDGIVAELLRDADMHAEQEGV